MLSIVPRRQVDPDGASQVDDIRVDQFRARLSELGIDDDSLREPISDNVRLNVIGQRWDFMLLESAAALGVGGAPSAADLLRLLRWFRDLVPATTELVIVDHSSGEWAPLDGSSDHEQFVSEHFGLDW